MPRAFPFTAETVVRLCSADGVPAAEGYRVTTASLHPQPAGRGPEYVLGLQHPDPDVGFQHFARVWCTAAGEWLGTGSGCQRGAAPVRLAVTGLATRAVPTPPNGPGSDAPVARRSPAVHAQAAALPAAPALPDAELHDGQRAPARRRAAARPAPADFDLFAPLGGF